MNFFLLLRYDKYYFLLASQVLFILLLGFFPAIAEITDLFVSLSLSIILLTCLNLLNSRRVHYRIGLAIAIVFIILSTATQFQNLPLLFFSTFLAFFALFILVAINIVKMLLRHVDGTSSLIAGSLSGYLLMAISFAFFLVALMGFMPNILNVPAKEIGFNGALYFSLITLTSTGYGEILPVHPFVKSVTSLVAVAGQFYMAVVVAVIVGKYMGSKK